MPNLRERLADAAESKGWDTSTSRLVLAPQMGGEYKSSGVLLRNGDVSAELGKYSTNTQGSNVYGHLGYQPFSAGPVRFGGTVGGYGPQSSPAANLILGLLATTPIAGGEARAVLSPSYGSSQQPGIFLGYTKKF